MSSPQTREDFIYMAKIAEQAARYEDMVDWMEKVAMHGEELTAEERNLLSVGYKNVVSTKRATCRILSSIEQKEETKGNSHQEKEMITEFRLKVESELADICTKIIALIDEHLLPSSADRNSGSPVFFWKMISMQEGRLLSLPGGVQVRKRKERCCRAVSESV